MTLDNLVVKYVYRNTKPFVDRYVLPVSVFLAASLESLKLGNKLHEALQSRELEAEGPLTRSLDLLISYVPTIASITLIAVPATLALANYSKNKTYRKNLSGSTVKRAYKSVTKFIENKYVLPTLTVLGMLHVAAEDTGFIDSLSNGSENLVISSVELAAISGLAFAASRKLYKYFSNKPNSPRLGCNFLQRKMPVVSLVSSLALANAVYESPQPQNTMQYMSNAFSEIQTLSQEDLEEVVEREEKQMDYFEIIDYYNKIYNTDSAIVKAILVKESGSGHWKRKGVPKESRKGAIEAGQLTKVMIENLNDAIKRGKLSGPEFNWQDIRNNPAENIRAAVAAVSYLQAIFVRNPQDNRSWELVAAAYNKGKTRIQKETNRNRNFWKFAKRLSGRSETIPFVQSVMALRYIYRNKVVWPADSRRVTDGFKSKRHKRHHYGIDISPIVKGEDGDRVMATVNGRVKEASRGKERGLYVVLQHGEPEWRFYTTYMHGKSIIARPGDYVKAGDTIMLMGNSGRSTNVHLHFEAGLHLFGSGFTHIDPNLIFKTASVEKVPVVVSERVARQPKPKPSLFDQFLAYLEPREIQAVPREAADAYNSGNHEVRVNQDYAAAISHYMNALSTAIGTTLADDIYLKLGDCYAGLGDLNKAIEMYEKGISLKDDQQEALKKRLEFVKSKANPNNN